MTSIDSVPSPEPEPAPEPETPTDLPAARRPSLRVRFALAFGASLTLGLLVGAGAISAYDRQYAGRILPGVHVGSVDLSGLDRAAAIDRLRDAFASLSAGELVLATSDGDARLAFADIGRGPAAEVMADEALAVGRSGTAVEQAAAAARSALRGTDLALLVTFDAGRLSARLDALIASIERPPVDGSVSATPAGFIRSPARNGVAVDAAALARSVVDLLSATDAAVTVSISVPTTSVTPAIEDPEASDAKAAADRMAAWVMLVDGQESWTIPIATVRTWIVFASTGDGRYVATVDGTAVRTALTALATQIDQTPKDATFLFDKSGAIVGVNAGRDGRALDVNATADQIAAALEARAAAQAPDPSETLAPVLAVTAPTLSTAQAEQVAPLMTQISSWTTYFQVLDRNGFGANIWVPAQIIDGTVVGPGKTFDFWKTVGPVTPERGFKQGGAIINGRTEPQGAIGGGICSTSTTLFNAALRAGLRMGVRMNHFYYIDRYPLGLDATVFISASGSVQSMSWTNDTQYPVLVKSYGGYRGGRAYVRFAIFGVPTGRTVEFTTPIVKNVLPASDTVEYSADLPAGARERVEYPVQGMDVWVTRTVRDANGSVIHQETYYSHYTRINGLTLIGTGGAPVPSPSPSPSPSPTPQPSPSA